MGQDNSFGVLAQGHKLKEYEIRGVLGSGSFGVTYLAFDKNLNCEVAIKEYLPGEWANRKADDSVDCATDDQRSQFAWGLKAFVQEAQILALFKHPNIVGIHRFFKAHNTAYIVMDYESGQTLSRLVTLQGPLSARQTENILLPILRGLRLVHGKGFLHRDIKPQNIIIREDGSPVLIDFGAARQAIGAATKTITSIVTLGYAPIEQYSSRARLGPWSDIYAMAAVGHYCLLGKKPSEAADRVVHDDFQALVEQFNDNSALLKALDRGLQVREKDRPRNIDQWLLQMGSSDDDTLVNSKAPKSQRLRDDSVDPEMHEFVPWHESLGSTEVLADNDVHVDRRSKPARPNRERNLLFLMMLGVLLVALYIRFAVDAEYPLQVNVQPAAAQIELLNSELQYQQGIKLIPGEYTIEVSYPGYISQRLNIAITDQGQTQSIILQRQKRRLLVSVTPPEAKISMPGVEQPYRDNVALDPGRYSMQISAPGYVAQMLNVDLTQADQQFKVELQRQQRRLRVITRPADAKINLPGSGLQYQPNMALAPGLYDVEVSAPGYIVQRKTVAVQNKDMQLEILLVALKRQLSIEVVPAYAQISFLDSNISYQAGMRLPASQYRLKVSAEGYLDKEISLDLRKSDQRIAVSLERIVHKLTILAEPASATITLLDIAEIYQSGMRLPAERYRIRVSASGYLSHQQWVDLSTSDQTLSIKLTAKQGRSSTSSRPAAGSLPPPGSRPPPPSGGRPPPPGSRPPPRR